MLLIIPVFELLPVMITCAHYAHIIKEEQTYSAEYVRTIREQNSQPPLSLYPSSSSSPVCLPDLHPSNSYEEHLSDCVPMDNVHVSHAAHSSHLHEDPRP